jgi:hypothetical protein
MREDEYNQQKISAPLPLRETYRLIPFSVISISLDSPFKYISSSISVDTTPIYNCNTYQNNPYKRKFISDIMFVFVLMLIFCSFLYLSYRLHVPCSLNRKMDTDTEMDMDLQRILEYWVLVKKRKKNIQISD